MLAIDPAACTELAESLDPRIQKVSFRNVAGPSPWSPPPPEPASLSNGNRTAKLVEVVVFVDGRTETAGVLEFASVLAQEHGAHLTGVFTQPEPTVTPVPPVHVIVWFEVRSNSGWAVLTIAQGMSGRAPK